MQTRLRGIVTALITPLDVDGTVDLAGLGLLVDRVIGAGSTGVVVLGGTGEYTALSTSERERAIAAVVERVDRRVPVIAGLLSPGIGDAIEIARRAERLEVDYLMPVTPYYVHPSQPGLANWFRRLADATQVPLILYNIPSRTGVNLKPETIARLHDELGRIAGIKECSTDLGQFAELVALVGGKVAILSGEEFFTLPHLLLGADGAILASANLLPAQWVNLFAATAGGDFRLARSIYAEMFPLLRALFSETNPGPLKEALRVAGLPAGPVSDPLTAPAPELAERIQHELSRLAMVQV